MVLRASWANRQVRIRVCRSLSHLRLPGTTLDSFRPPSLPLPAFLNPFLFKPEMPHEDYGTCRVISGADPQPPPSPTRQLLTPSIALDHPKMPRATGFIFYHL